MVSRKGCLLKAHLTGLDDVFRKEDAQAARPVDKRPVRKDWARQAGTFSDFGNALDGNAR